MADVARPSDFQAHVRPHRPSTAVKAPVRPGLLRRLFDAFIDGRQRRMQPEIERFVAWHGRSFTDSFEREIGARMLSGNWNPRR